MNKKIFGGVAIFAIAMLLAGPVLAAEFKGGESISFRQGETVADNLYAAGGNLTAEGSIEGDFLAVGGTVLFTGRVTNDAAIAGGTLSLLGEVGGDLRAAGGNISLGGPVGGELIVAGGQISASSRCLVEKSATFAGGTVSFDGETKGKLEIRGGEVVVNGKVGGELFVQADKLTIGKDAVISGNLNYESPDEAVVEQGSQITGEINFKKTERGSVSDGRGFAWGAIVGGWFVRLLIMLVLGLLLFFVFKRGTTELVKRNLAEFGWQLLRGLVVMIVVPIASVIAAVTIIGLPVAGVFMLLYAMFWILSGAIAGMTVGSLACKIIWKKEIELDWKIVAGGIFAYCLLTAIPYLGWIFAAVFCLVAFGGWWNFLYERAMKER